MNRLYIKEDYPSKIKALVIINHGLAEHSGRYDELTNFLNQNEIGVFRYDQRLHGKSTNFTIKETSNYLYNLLDLRKHVLYLKEKFPNTPIFLIGHSMGGVVSNLYAEFYNDISGIILSSAVTTVLPYLKLFDPYKRPLKLFYKINIKLKANLKMIILNDDEKDSYLSDPLILKKVPLSILAEQLINGAKYARKNINFIKVPYLVMHGKKDLLIPYLLSKRFYEKLVNVPYKKLELIDNASHEIFKEKNKYDFAYKYTLEFINDILKGSYKNESKIK